MLPAQRECRFAVADVLSFIKRLRADDGRVATAAYHQNPHKLRIHHRYCSALPSSSGPAQSPRGAPLTRTVGEETAYRAPKREQWWVD